MTALLLQPLGPFVLAIAAGLMAGVLATSSRSLLVFAVTVLGTALVLAVLDLGANLRAHWIGVPPEPAGWVPLRRVVWELVTANVVVIAVVGAAAFGLLSVLR